MASDGQHPHHFEQITLDATSQNSLIKLHKPSEGWIVLDDCVSMDCDGPKHVLLNDVDGSLLGASNGGGNGGGSIIAKAEYFSHENNWQNKWHKRNPKTLPNQILVNLDNKDVPLKPIDVVNTYGIVRTGCASNTAWNAHACSSTAALGHRMLVVESLDGDHETRSIIPLTLAHDKTGKYLSEGAAREWSTVVDICIPSPYFKPVSLFLLRSSLF